MTPEDGRGREGDEVSYDFYGEAQRALNWERPGPPRPDSIKEAHYKIEAALRAAFAAGVEEGKAQAAKSETPALATMQREQAERAEALLVALDRAEQRCATGLCVAGEDLAAETRRAQQAEAALGRAVEALRAVAPSQDWTPGARLAHAVLADPDGQRAAEEWRALAEVAEKARPLLVALDRAELRCATGACLSGEALKEALRLIEKAANTLRDSEKAVAFSAEEVVARLDAFAVRARGGATP